MDAKREQLQKKLDELIKEATSVAVELQGVEQGAGVPHFDQIEGSARELGRRLSRAIQTERAGVIAGSCGEEVPCPTCKRKCPTQTDRRELGSLDGPLKILEVSAHCRHCRRSFFPSAERIGS